MSSLPTANVAYRLPRRVILRFSRGGKFFDRPLNLADKNLLLKNLLIKPV
nr:hypothetical protein [Trichocoleus desertorum]